MSRFYSTVASNILTPAYDILTGTSRLRCSRILDRTQWSNRKEMEELRNKSLRHLLKRAYDSVPYYHRVFKERNLVPGDIETASDLKKLPVLRKSDIRKHFDDLRSRDCDRSETELSRSGGTGDPISFLVTKESKSWEISAEYRAYGWAGYRFGDRCLMFWGSPLDISKRQRMLNRFTSKLNRILVLDTYILSDSVLGKYAQIMERYNPEIIRGYASSVYMMAKFLEKKGVASVRPRAIITSAETLLEHQRKTIEDAFNSTVFDYYGSREIGAIASECEEHDGYHINSENVIVEYVKDGESAGPGESGVILLTSLRNFGMPFIRYEIGDVGKPSEEQCACGRGLPLMDSIEGRISQFMAVYDEKLKRIIPVSTAAPGPFSNVFRLVPLESYRIVQETLDRVVVKAVKGEGYRDEHTTLVINHLREFLGDRVKIEFEFLEEIPPLPSGKRSVFISKINPFQNN